MKEQVSKEALVADGWTMTADQTPKANTTVSVKMLNAERVFVRKAFINDDGVWFNASSGLSIFSNIIAWKDEGGNVSTAQHEVFTPFLPGDNKAVIGYWVGVGDEAKFSILSTMSNHDNIYPNNDFYNVVMKLVGTLNNNASRNLNLDVYNRYDAPEFLNLDGESK